MDEKASKMQEILDKVQEAVDVGDEAGAILQLIEAVKLLSKAQQQMFDRIDRVSRRTNG